MLNILPVLCTRKCKKKLPFPSLLHILHISDGPCEKSGKLFQTMSIFGIHFQRNDRNFATVLEEGATPWSPAVMASMPVGRGNALLNFVCQWAQVWMGAIMDLQIFHRGRLSHGYISSSTIFFSVPGPPPSTILIPVQLEGFHDFDILWSFPNKFQLVLLGAGAILPSMPWKIGNRDPDNCGN